MDHSSPWIAARCGARGGALSYAVVAAVALLLAPAARAQLVRIHCGDLNGYAAEEPGYALLSETATPPGVSLFPAPLDTVHVASWLPQLSGVLWPSNVATIDPGALSASHRFTSLALADNSVLTLEGLPPSAGLRVRLEVGALAPWMELNAQGSGWEEWPSVCRDMRVDVQKPGTTSPPVTWTTVADHVRCSTGSAGNSFATDLGGITSVWIRCRSDAAGRLRLRLATGGDDPVLLCSVEVHAVEALPVLYQRTAAGPLKAQTPGVAPFVAAFNAGDYDAAQSAALALPDAWERGVALLHLVGWLDGSRDGRVDLIPEAQAALLAAKTAGHAGAPWLLAQLDTLSLALQHLQARGFTSAKLCPEQGGAGFLNPDCSGQADPPQQSDVNVNAHIALRELSGLVAGRGAGPTVLHDLAAWNAGTLPADVFEPSPLVFRALKEYGLALVGLNPQQSVSLTDPESAEMHQRLVDIFGGFMTLGFFAEDFPDEMELPLFDAFAQAGSNPKDWPTAAVKVLDDTEIAASWWGADVQLSASDRDAPDWANAQRRFLALHRAIQRYWLLERLSGGEFGGGPGDDVELLLQLWPVLAVLRDQRDAAPLARLQDAIRFALEDSGGLKDGYYGGPPVDVEHNAEFTTDPYLAEAGVFGPTARALRTALGVGKHLKAGGGPAAFGAPTVLGRWHFRSAIFNADGPSLTATPTLDTLLHGRATIPATVTLLRAPLSITHPLVTDLREWAAAWRDDALDESASTHGKPPGFVGPIEWPGNGFGTGGIWYSDTGSEADTSQFDTGETSYVLELLRLAYRSSTAPDRWTYLLPAVRLFRTVQLWEDAGQPQGAPGSSNWAAGKLKAGARFGPMVIAMLGEFVSDPDLSTLPDPWLGGAQTYVDATLLARMRHWVEVEYSGQTPALHYALGPVFPCSLHATKPSNDLIGPYTAAVDYYRNWFPLLTARVLHTDRVFANLSNVLTHVAGGVSGGVLSEGLSFEPRVRWRAPPGGVLDLAVHSNLRDETGEAHSAFIYNFAASATPVELLLDAGLRPGIWSIELGPADVNCDEYLPGTVLATDLVVDKRGAGLVAPLLVQPGLQLLRMTRTSSSFGAAPAWDIALDAPRAVLHVATDLSLSLQLSTRVANAGRVAAPAVSVRFWVDTVSPAGDAVLPGGFPLSSPVSSGSFALPATSGWSASETTASVTLPLPAAAATWLLAGNGLQLRAELSSAAADADATNDSQSRVEFLSTVPLVVD